MDEGGISGSRESPDKLKCNKTQLKGDRQTGGGPMYDAPTALRPRASKTRQHVYTDGYSLGPRAT